MGRSGLHPTRPLFAESMAVKLEVAMIEFAFRRVTTGDNID